MTTPTTSAQPVREEALRLALAERSRPPRPSALSASLTFGWRALLKIKHVPEQLFDVTAIPIMFTLMFTYLFGGALAGSTGEYLQFLLPGILVQTVVFITIYTGFTLNTDITKGVFDRFRSLPIWRPSVLVGALLGDAARYTMASTMVIALGLVLGFRPPAVWQACCSRWRSSSCSPSACLGSGPRSGWSCGRLNSVMGVSMMVLFPAHVREQRLRGPADHAVVVAVRRRVQPHHPPGDGGARADGRNGDARPSRAGARILRSPHRCLRADHHVPVPQQELAPARRRAGRRYGSRTRRRWTPPAK
jgi:ABC-2 type transport system permease protein